VLDVWAFSRASSSRFIGLLHRRGESADEGAMPELKYVIFLVLMAGVAAVVPLVAQRASKRGGEQVQQALESVAATGAAVEQATSQRGRQVVRVWGTLAHPVSLELRIARRSLWRRFGSGYSTGMLDPRFERAFRIVTNEPERARLILDPDLQQRLLASLKIELRVGSFDSLLPPDYWPRDETKPERRLRRLWMIRVPGKLEKVGSPETLVEIGRLLARGLAKHCLPPLTPDVSEFETRSSEGEWL
jgi:hypothetical protein